MKLFLVNLLKLKKKKKKIVFQMILEYVKFLVSTENTF